MDLTNMEKEYTTLLTQKSRLEERISKCQSNILQSLENLLLNQPYEFRKVDLKERDFFGNVSKTTREVYYPVLDIPKEYEILPDGFKFGSIYEVLGEYDMINRYYDIRNKETGEIIHIREEGTIKNVEEVTIKIDNIEATIYVRDKKRKNYIVSYIDFIITIGSNTFKLNKQYKTPTEILQKFLEKITLEYSELSSGISKFSRRREMALEYIIQEEYLKVYMKPEETKKIKELLYSDEDGTYENKEANIKIEKRNVGREVSDRLVYSRIIEMDIYGSLIEITIIKNNNRIRTLNLCSAIVNDGSLDTKIIPVLSKIVKVEK